MALILAGCQPNENDFKKRVEKVIKENPEIVLKVIKERPLDFVSAFQDAVQVSRKELTAQREQAAKKELMSFYSKPLTPQIREDESIRGSSNAPLTLVEYTDFECPYCARGAQTVTALKALYGDKLRVIYKHLPLSFHPNAFIAAQYFEGIRMQSKELAFKFHDQLFKNQSQIKKGEKYLKELSRSLGVNLNKLSRDIKAQKVVQRIKEDLKEARKFGIEGTPGFVLNGIPIKGAYPLSHFKQIISELENRSLVKL